MLEFPRWKYVLIVLILAVSVLYALPNKYQKDPSVQITANRGAQVDDALESKVVAILGVPSSSPRRSRRKAIIWWCGWRRWTTKPAPMT